MRRRPPLLRLVLSLTLGLVAVATLLLFVVRIDRVAVAPGKLAGATVAVRALRDGRVAAIRVEGGRSVGAGEALGSLDPGELTARLREGETRVAGAERHLAARREERGRRITETHPAARREAERALERARIEHDRAATRERILGELEERGLATALDVREGILDRELADVARAEAADALDRLGREQAADLARLDDEIAGIAALLEEERGGLAEVRRLLGLSELAAPAAGRVSGIELGELLGVRVSEGDELFRIATADPSRFLGELPDAGQGSVRVGQRVRIRLTAYPWLIHGTLDGRVAVVADAQSANGGLPVVVAIDDDDPPGVLREGMTGKARILVDENVTLGRILVERVAGLGRP